MKAKAQITYSIVTPESAEYGDDAERGWYLPGGWTFALMDEDGEHEEVLEAAQRGEYDLSIGEAIREAESLGIHEDSGSWIDSVDPDIDYATGGETRYSLHLDGITGASYRRVVRYLNGENIYGREE